MNDLINQNRNYYGVDPKKSQSVIKTLKDKEDCSLTIANMVNENQQYYKPCDIIVEVEEIKQQSAHVSQHASQQDVADYTLTKMALTYTSVPEIIKLDLIYNYKTIIKNGGIGLDEIKKLDIMRIKRKDRQQKNSQPQDEAIQGSAKKKYVRIYKNHISKLHFQAPNNLKLISYDLKNNQKWVKPLALQDFGNMRPSFSLVQEKTTGRFYIYDNSCGKVHIYSSDMLINSNKDKPLVSLNLNEETPRQDPLLYLIECEHEFQWKSVLLVIGGHHQQKNQSRPLRTIKVFEIKRREVSLTPALTINMQYPRMNPIVFDLAKQKGMYWQEPDIVQDKSESQNKVDQRYIFIMAGNPLLEFDKEYDPELRAANQTCEYIQLKQVLDHINRAQQFTPDEHNQLGLNFGKVQMVDTLNIKYQNGQIPEKVYNHLHHAVTCKIQDDVFSQSYYLIIMGGNRVETIQLQAIQQQLNEINFTSAKLQLTNPTKIWSNSNVKYMKSAYYFDQSHVDVQVIYSMDSRGNNKTSCACNLM